MRRITVILGLSLALLAWAAGVVGSASAAELKAETYPTHLRGVQVGEQAFKFEGNTLT